MYFRIAATDENFAGDIIKVYVGPKGKDPNLGIDYTNVRTKNTIGSDIIYGLSAAKLNGIVQHVNGQPVHLSVQVQVIQKFSITSRAIITL
mgnify:CR=1 FL=1